MEEVKPDNAETLTGTVEHIVFANEENGWTVLSALRAVPKAPQKDENADVLAKLLAE